LIPLQLSLSHLWTTQPERVAPMITSELATSLLLKLLGKPGYFKVLVHQPCPNILKKMAYIESIPLSKIPLTRSLRLEYDGMLHFWQKKARLIWIDRPHFPTAQSASISEIKTLCQDISGHALVVVNEMDITYTNMSSCAELLDQTDNLLILKNTKLSDDQQQIAWLGPENWMIALNTLAEYFGLYSINAMESARQVDEQLISHAPKVTSDIQQRFVDLLDQQGMVDKVFDQCSHYLMIRMLTDKFFEKELQKTGVEFTTWPKLAGLESCVCFTRLDDDQFQILKATLENTKE
ncbi:MAG: hypothetical protein ACWA5R_14645, partial [bacterium]